MEKGNRVFTAYDAGVMEQYALRPEDLEFIGGHAMAVSALWGRCEKNLGRIQALGIPVAFDCADLPFDPVAQTALPHVDIAFFSDDGADQPLLEQICRTLHAQGPATVVAMRGAQGSLAFDGAKFYTQKALPCHVVDTLGAGDSYIAGFLHATLRGLPMEERMRAGAECSKVTIGYMGAW